MNQSRRSTRTPSRQPAGVPTGGQFAARSRPEADVELGVDPAPAIAPTELFAFHRNPDGSPGGLVALSATVAPTATVADHATVRDYAEVRDTSSVLGHATVSGEAIVCGGSVVEDGAVVSGSAVVEAGSVVSGSAVIDREAHVTQGATVAGDAHVTNDGFVAGGWAVDGVVDDTATSPPVRSDGPDAVPSAWLDEDDTRPYAGRRHDPRVIPAFFSTSALTPAARQAR